MNGFQFVAFYVWPFVMLAFVLGTVKLIHWQDRREDARAAAQPASGSSPSSSMPKPDRPT